MARKKIDHPLIHRWMRKAYHRGHSWVNNQICVGIGNSAAILRGFWKYNCRLWKAHLSKIICQKGRN